VVLRARERLYFERAEALAGACMEFAGIVSSAGLLCGLLLGPTGGGRAVCCSGSVGAVGWVGARGGGLPRRRIVVVGGWRVVS